MGNVEQHRKIAEEQRSRMPYGNYSVDELMKLKSDNQERIDLLTNQSDTLTEIEYRKKFETPAEDANFVKEVELVNLELAIKDIDQELKRRELLN